MLAKAVSQGILGKKKTSGKFVVWLKLRMFTDVRTRYGRTVREVILFSIHSTKNVTLKINGKYAEEFFFFFILFNVCKYELLFKTQTTCNIRREILNIWHRYRFALWDKLIKIWWSKFKDHFDLAEQDFGPNSINLYAAFYANVHQDKVPKW